MSHDEFSQIKSLIEDLKEQNTQQRSSHHSDLLKQIVDVKKEIAENTKLTIELSKHPMFKAWNDGKTIAKFIKWGGIAIIGVSTLIVAIKNGGSIIKEYLKFALKI